MNSSTPGLPVHHQLPEFTQTHVHLVGDAIQPSHALLSPSPPALSLSQHQGLFKWVSSLHQVAKSFSNESALCISIGVSASASVLPMNTQDTISLAVYNDLSHYFLIATLYSLLSKEFFAVAVLFQWSPKLYIYIFVLEIEKDLFFTPGSYQIHLILICHYRDKVISNWYIRDVVMWIKHSVVIEMPGS